jgi:gluconate kinase
MPLTDEEWAAFISEYNGMVADVVLQVERLVAACQALQRGAARVDGREALQTVAQTYLALVEVQSRRIQERINAPSKRINEMRALGEL